MNHSKSLQSLLERSAEKWRSCEGQPACELLRLVVLRELVQSLHAEKSRLLSGGKRDETTDIRGIESRIELLRNTKPLAGDLTDLLLSNSELKKRSRLLPSAVFTAIDREKLERFDRHWEAAIASEALAEGWSIWALENWVEIARVEEWNQKLVDQLWPRGIVLFVESVGAHNETCWLGRWICVLHSKIHTPAEAFAALGDFTSWHGAVSRAPSAPHVASWRVLFSPKSR